MFSCSICGASERDLANRDKFDGETVSKENVGEKDEACQEKTVTLTLILQNANIFIHLDQCLGILTHPNPENGGANYLLNLYPYCARGRRKEDARTTMVGCSAM
jgi:hypothetical protein